MAHCLLSFMTTLIVLLPYTIAHGYVDPYLRKHEVHSSSYVPGFTGAVPAKPRVHARYHIPALRNYHYTQPSGTLYAVNSGGEPGINRLRRFRVFPVPENIVNEEEPPVDWRRRGNNKAYGEWRKNTTLGEWIRTIRNIYFSAWYADGNDLSIDRTSLRIKVEKYFPGSQLRLILAPPGLTRLGDTFRHPFHPISAQTALFTYHTSMLVGDKAKDFALEQDCVILHRFAVQSHIEPLAPLMLVLIFDQAKPPVSNYFYASVKARNVESVKLFNLEGKKCHDKSKFGFTSLLETFPGSLSDLLTEIRTRHLSLGLKSPSLAWKLHEYNLRKYFPNGYFRTILPNPGVALEIEDFNLEPWADVIWPGQLMYTVKPHIFGGTQHSGSGEDSTSVWNDHNYDVILPFESECADNILDFNLLATRLTDDFVEDPWLKFVDSVLAEEDERSMETLKGKELGELSRSLKTAALSFQGRLLEVLRQHSHFIFQLSAQGENVVASFGQQYLNLLELIKHFPTNLMRLVNTKGTQFRQAWIEAKAPLDEAYRSLFRFQHLLAIEQGLAYHQPFYHAEKFKLVKIEEEGRLLDSPFIVPPGTRFAHVLHLRWNQKEMDSWADALLHEPNLDDLSFRLECVGKSPKGIKFLYNSSLSPPSDTPSITPIFELDDSPKLLQHLVLPGDDPFGDTGGQVPMIVYEHSVTLADLDLTGCGFAVQEDPEPNLHPSVEPTSKLVIETENPKTIDDIFGEREQLSTPSPNPSIEQTERIPTPLQFDSPVLGPLILTDSSSPVLLDDLVLTGMGGHSKTTSSTSPPSQFSPNHSPASSRHASPQSDLGVPSPTHQTLSLLPTTGAGPVTDSPTTSTSSRTNGESGSDTPLPIIHSNSSVLNVGPPPTTTASFESDWSLLSTSYSHLNASWKTLFGAIIRSFTMPSHLQHLDELLKTYSTTTLPGTSHGILVAGAAGSLSKIIFTSKKISSSQSTPIALACNALNIYFVPACTTLALIRPVKKKLRRVVLPHDAIVFPLFKGNEPSKILKSGEKVKPGTPLMRWVRFQEQEES